MKKRGLLFVLAMMLMAAFVFASGGKEEAAATSFEGKTLKVIIKDLPMLRMIAEVMDAQAEKMGMKLQHDWYTWEDLRKKVVLDHKAGLKHWDIIGMGEYWFVTHSGCAEPINKYVDDPKIADPKLKEWLDDTFPAAIDYMTTDGNFWGFPLYSGVTGLGYRSDLFNSSVEKAAFKAKYGYDLKAPDTYDQYYDIAEFFTRKKGEMLDGKPLENDFFGIAHSLKPGGYFLHDYLPYALAYGIPKTYYHDPETKQPIWNSPAHIKSAKFLLSMKPFMPPGTGTMTSGASTSLFADGRVAMIYEWVGRMILLNNKKDTSKIIGKWEYTVSPSVPGTGVKGAAMSNQHQLMLYTNGQNKLASFKLMEKVFSPEAVRSLAFDKNMIVPRKSILNDPEFTKLDWAANLGMMFDPELTSHSYHPPIPLMTKIFDIIGVPLGEFWTEMKSVEQVFGEAQEKLVEAYKEAGYIK
jgi:multiple sugar transport system substrate-binding protein